MSSHKRMMQDGSAQGLLIIKRLLLSLLVVATGCSVAVAEGEDVASTSSFIEKSVISDGALSNVNGVISINQAAGDDNAQANSQAIAISHNGGVAIAYVLSDQRSQVDLRNSPDIAISQISGNAFSNASGLLAINQTAGTGNLQLNSFVVSGSIDGELTDEMLSETLTGMSAISGNDGTGSNTQRTVSVDRTAFIGASGVVQISQVAGTGNVTRNRFEMSFDPQH